MKKLPTETPLFHATYKLYLAWHLRCGKIPKADRFTIGAKVAGTLLEIIVASNTAYRVRDNQTKHDLLAKADLALESAKVTIRLAKDVRAIEFDWYLGYEKQLQEIGKMLGGWINSLNKTNG